jgi:hypothetical protein
MFSTIESFRKVLDKDGYINMMVHHFTDLICDKKISRKKKYQNNRMASEITRFESNREYLVVAQRKSGKKEITAIYAMNWID